jgi:PAS domain S-box-containing protein
MAKPDKKNIRECRTDLRGLFELSHDVIVFLDRAGNIIDINPRAEELTGYSRSALLGMNVFRHLIIPKDRVLMRQVVRDAFQGRTRTYEERWTTKGGEIVYFDGLTVPLLSMQGEVLSTYCTLRDITVRKKLEGSLRQTLMRTESILASVSDIYILFDRQWRYLYVNEAGVRAIGKTRDEILEHTLWELYPDIEETELGRQYRLAMERRTPVTFEFHYATLGTWWENRFYPAPEGLAVFATDITKRKRAEEALNGCIGELADMNKALRAEHRQLRRLGTRAAAAAEEERKRIARELHDRVGQHMAILGINLNIVQAMLAEKDGDGAQRRIEDSLHLVSQVTEALRGMMTELRPPVLDDYGLGAALDWYGAQFAARTAIPVIVRGADNLPKLAHKIEDTLFRIAQEALTNVAKHAKARKVTVGVEAEPRTIRLSIVDDGIGFDASDLSGLRKRRKWGLFTMKERAEAVGGQCRIESHPGRGTRLVVEVPR